MRQAERVVREVHNSLKSNPILINCCTKFRSTYDIRQIRYIGIHQNKHIFTNLVHDVSATAVAFSAMIFLRATAVPAGTAESAY